MKDLEIWSTSHKPLSRHGVHLCGDNCSLGTALLAHVKAPKDVIAADWLLHANENRGPPLPWLSSGHQFVDNL
jgi:hypothetical protein